MNDRRGFPVAFRIQKYLSGMHYPADKAAIIQFARAKGADDRALLALSELPDREFASPVALSSAMTRW